MNEDLSDRIRERAYEIWLLSGRREGQAEQHWLAAERDIVGASSAFHTLPPVSARRTKGRAKSKASAPAKEFQRPDCRDGSAEEAVNAR
jgi:hypothetical protein